MLTEEQLEYISDALVPLFQYLESEVIADVAQRVKATMAFTRTAELEAQALYELGYSPAYIRKKVMKKLNADTEYRKLVAGNTLEHKKNVKKLLREIQKEALRAGDKLFAQSGDLSFLDDLRVWKLGHKNITDDSFLPKLVRAIEMQTRGELKNLTRTTGFKTVAGMESLETVYRRELDQAMIKITSGTFSQEQVLYGVIHNLAHSGLRTVDYGTGRTMQLDTAARLAVRTGTHQLMGKIAEQNIRETDTDMVYVSSHWGARNKGQGHANHAEWQGKVYSIVSSVEADEAGKEAARIGQAEIKDLWEATGYCMDGMHENDPLGLYGYNCRHRIYPWFRGISSLPDEDPEPEPVTIDGKQYDYYAMSQKQRAMESQIRALKREREALQKLGMDTKEVQKKIRDKISQYEKFCKDYKMPEKYNRIRYDNGTGEYKKTRAWKEYEKKHKADLENVAKEAEGGIIDPRRVESGGKRNEQPLTGEQIEEVTQAMRRQGYRGDIMYSEHSNTAFHGSTEGEAYHYVVIGTDAYPNARMGKSANERISANGCAAHEIVGHYETWKKGTALDDIVLDEAQASIRASKFGVGLSDAERTDLMADAMERLERAGIDYEQVRDLLDIWER